MNLLHGLRAAMTPVVVLIGFRLPMLIGGAVVVEEVFQWPGIGVLFVDAVRSQNTPLVMIIGFSASCWYWWPVLWWISLPRCWIRVLN